MANRNILVLNWQTWRLWIWRQTYYCARNSSGSRIRSMVDEYSDRWITSRLILWRVLEMKSGAQRSGTRADWKQMTTQVSNVGVMRTRRKIKIPMPYSAHPIVKNVKERSSFRCYRDRKWRTREYRYEPVGVHRTKTTGVAGKLGITESG